ncbi:ABC transporter-related protein [Leptothrix cholodnii SP-6]|uniref:ABC transporter-related protein n=1 Tax=Leptothrix cholodnii (strain ATCC 51168 / LMG 8142 / SP-6) TaxID=395495 RepID=B1XZV4_LEPCP|nr:ATP-binding cassette domain-containing protein [Leptothrix cholodnii]ACB34081.1 ABC transporter-related protein [Leptothrix cholodnii SP-6]
MSGEALISLAQAGVDFGAVRALRDVTLQINRGERVALVGANGSGKTTLLRLLHGLVAGHGRREVHALEDTDGRPALMAMLFQRPYLLHLSARSNLLLALWLAKVPRAQRGERAAQALERVGLQGVGERAARALSGGQQQRLAMARAWAMRPDILFLDEPTASLDPSAKREVESLIDAFGADGMTLVMSTHNLGQVKRLATRVLYLEAGHVVVDLPVERFFHDPLPHAAAQFLKGELPWT